MLSREEIEVRMNDSTDFERWRKKPTEAGGTIRALCETALALYDENALLTEEVKKGMKLALVVDDLRTENARLREELQDAHTASMRRYCEWSKRVSGNLQVQMEEENCFRMMCITDVQYLTDGIAITISNAGKPIHRLEVENETLRADNDRLRDDNKKHIETILGLEQSFVPLMKVFEAAKEIQMAIHFEGPNPRYHHEVVAQMKREWPTIWKAIDALEAALEKVGGGE